MKASCVLCGFEFNSLPDLSVLDSKIRGHKEFAEIGRMMMHHLGQTHRKTMRLPFTDPDLTGPMPIPSLIGAVGMLAQSAVATSYLQSEDAVFQELSANLAIVVTAAMKQVEPAPTLSLG